MCIRATRTWRRLGNQFLWKAPQNFIWYRAPPRLLINCVYIYFQLAAVKMSSLLYISRLFQFRPSYNVLDLSTDESSISRMLRGEFEKDWLYIYIRVALCDGIQIAIGFWSSVTALFWLPMWYRNIAILTIDLDMIDTNIFSFLFLRDDRYNYLKYTRHDVSLTALFNIEIELFFFFSFTRPTMM